tara:strand:- start:33462 stop:34232 length:771 start_codon:yes stop_codon:yes gene_type:complete
MREFKIRASAAYALATRPQGGTNIEKYEKSITNLENLKARYESFKNKKCKSAIEILRYKMPNAEKEIKELELIKDVPVFSETTKSYVNDWYKEQVYGIKKDFYAKQTEKGLMLEDEAIDKSIDWLDLPFAVKNDEYFEDEYFTGTPDIILNDEIIDTKCSWDAFTFPLLEDELPNKNYFYQMQVYMHLTGKRKARVVYMLLNTPEKLAKYETVYNYDHVSKEKRIRAFSVEYDPEVIEYLKEQVKAIRNHLNTFKK